MNKPPTDDKLRAALVGDRARILALLAAHGELSSGELRDRAEIPAGSKHYQLSILRAWGLIEPVGTQYVGEYETGIPATVYTLTENGHAIVDGR